MQKCPNMIELYACVLWIFVIIFLFPMNSLTFLEYVKLQSCQSWLHYHHSHAKLSNELLSIHTPQDLLHISNPLF